MNQPIIRIVTLPECALNHALTDGLDAIFFEGVTRGFVDNEARAAFRERWLGKYLTHWPNEAFIAFDEADGRVAGYLVGALCDPATDPHHADLDYFRNFAMLTRRYPAHLHINVASQHRSAGIGAHLIETFAAHAAANGAPGMHVVTGKGMRNVGFYLRQGFVELAEAPWNGKVVVMLGRKLIGASGAAGTTKTI